MLVFHDTSETRALARKLEYQALDDPLTGRINRCGFEARLTELLHSAKQRITRHALCYVHDLAIIRRRGEMRWVARLKHALEEDETCFSRQVLTCSSPNPRNRPPPGPAERRVAGRRAERSLSPCCR